ncbi:major histocompatibility complex class I-related gene protein-like [Antennarius striatus]|uniref:major histocompatibility complex class I-related gene protein-like n=1 Tax=Antennarius striatus TaxID=241820 RepID=UPI0035AEF045
MFVLRSVCLLLHLVTCSGSGRHSLWAMATYISGTTPFPEFTAVLMLDDIQVGYYDSDTDRLTRVGGAKGEGAELDLGAEALFVLRDIYSSMKKRLTLVKLRLNLTEARVHVQQRLTGCEVLADGSPAYIMFRDGSDGRDADSLVYNTSHFSYAGGAGVEIRWGAVKRLHFQTLYANIYLPFCVRTLQQLLRRERHLVARRVRPRVRLVTKVLGGGGARVTCLATDFYPRHINLTLLRDGVAVEAWRLSGGELLPNGNGLYQVRKTVVLEEAELRRGHNYTCSATHLSLDNRLEVSWRAELAHSHAVPAVLGPAGLVLAGVLVGAGLWWRRRRRERSVTKVTREQEPGAAEPMMATRR